MNEVSVINAILGDMVEEKKYLDKCYLERKELPNKIEVDLIKKSLEDVKVEVEEIKNILAKIEKVNNSYE